MSQMAAESSGQEQQQQQQQQEQQVNDNPAWSSLLDSVPSQLHSLIKPELAKWDRNVQQLLEKERNNNPYKTFIDEGIDPDTIKTALQVVQTMEADPKKFWEAVGEAYGLTQQQQTQLQQTSQQVASTPDDEKEPWQKQFEELQSQLLQVAQVVTQQQQQTTQQQNQQALEGYLDKLRDNHKNEIFPPDDFILPLLANGRNGEDAVKMFHDFIRQSGGKIELDPGQQQQQTSGQEQQQTTQTQQKAPDVLGAGSSGIPSNRIDFKNLKDDAVQELVVSILKKQKEAAS